MINLITKVIKDSLTGIDGETYDPARVAGVFGITTFLALSIYAVMWQDKAWDPQAFGIGFGSLLAGIGAGVMLKRHTEPQQ